MEYRKFDDIIIARIDKGEEIIEKVKEIASVERIALAACRPLEPLIALQREFFKRRRKNIWQMTLTAALKSYPDGNDQHDAGRSLLPFPYQRGKRTRTGFRRAFKQRDCKRNL